jgi:LPS O-antigen subunit length determinant protein (WzzB/FepE family)
LIFLSVIKFFASSSPSSATAHVRKTVETAQNSLSYLLVCSTNRRKEIEDREDHLLAESVAVLSARVEGQQELIEALQSQIQAQKDQLEAKDNQIEARAREVQELHVLLQQAQAALPPPRENSSWWRRVWRRD